MQSYFLSHLSCKWSITIHTLSTFTCWGLHFPRAFWEERDEIGQELIYIYIFNFNDICFFLALETNFLCSMVWSSGDQSLMSLRSVELCGGTSFIVRTMWLSALLAAAAALLGSCALFHLILELAASLFDQVTLNCFLVCAHTRMPILDAPKFSSWDYCPTSLSAARGCCLSFSNNEDFFCLFCFVLFCFVFAIKR